MVVASTSRWVGRITEILLLVMGLWFSMSDVPLGFGISAKYTGLWEVGPQWDCGASPVGYWEYLRMEDDL
ncbi:hypothetical protein FCV25MIE_22959 [Fagus crenata]